MVTTKLHRIASTLGILILASAMTFSCGSKKAPEEDEEEPLNEEDVEGTVGTVAQPDIDNGGASGGGSGGTNSNVVITTPELNPGSSGSGGNNSGTASSGHGGNGGETANGSGNGATTDANNTNGTGTDGSETANGSDNGATTDTNNTSGTGTDGGTTAGSNDGNGTGGSETTNGSDNGATTDNTNTSGTGTDGGTTAGSNDGNGTGTTAGSDNGSTDGGTTAGSNGTGADNGTGGQEEEPLQFGVNGLGNGALITNSSSVTLDGSCENGSVVTTRKAGTALAISQSSCIDSGFTIDLAKEIEGLSSFEILSTAGARASEVIAFTVDFDAIAPARPIITQPLQNPLLTSTNNVNLQGTCEALALVKIAAGTNQLETPCTSGGIFAYTLTALSYGTFTFHIVQVDGAANVSASTELSWQYSPAVPQPPVLTTPASSPVVANTRTLHVAGTCISQHLIVLSGDVANGEVGSEGLSRECNNGAFSYDVTKTDDGEFTLQLAQQNPSSGEFSNIVSILWRVDATAPSEPVLTLPLTNPFASMGDLDISGSCETGATVFVSGDEERQFECEEGSFTLTVSESEDGVYNYLIHQVDGFGNASEVLLLEWTRDSSVPASPTITQPATNPLRSTATTLTVSGTCSANHDVEISGDIEADDITQPEGDFKLPCNQGAFSFSLAKPAELPDDGYNLQIVQIDYKDAQSAPVGILWIIDREPSSVDFLTYPSDPSYSNRADFTFVAADPSATIQCKLDTQAWANCASPASRTSLANGTHTFRIRTIDGAGNISPEESYTWLQEAYNAVALYHFNSSPGSTVDSSLYGDLPLTSSNSSTVSTGKFSQARSFSSTGYNMRRAHHDLFNELHSTMTLEAWLRPRSLSRGEKHVIAHKSSSSAYSFEWFIQRDSGSTDRVRYGFTASINGVNTYTVTTGSLTYSTSSWYHVAATWNAGQVVLYVNGVIQGNGTIGTLGSAQIAPSTGELYIGNSRQGTYPLQSYLDEVRISRTVRYSGAFTPPTSAFSGD